MWRWEQGRLDYFQFDGLRKVAKFAIGGNLRQATREQLSAATGLEFWPQNYQPWRNYGRVFRLSMIAVPRGREDSEITEIGRMLADDGQVTTDEYCHFLAQATTDPSPALAKRDWVEFIRAAGPGAEPRYPLLFALKYFLTRAAQGNATTSIADVIDAYADSGFRGDEDQMDFLELVRAHPYPPANLEVDQRQRRQASESIKVLAQISYLTATSNEVTVSLDHEDGRNLLLELNPVGGPYEEDPADEVSRRASLLLRATTNLNLDYPATLVTDVEDAGFAEGNRVKRTHLTLERNSRLRHEFFQQCPTTMCDFCKTDTHARYPWTPKVLDIHHLLPLCSGARTSDAGTVLADLVANCPTCHRAVHRYYDTWLRNENQRDFEDAHQAREVYKRAKRKYKEGLYAAG